MANLAKAREIAGELEKTAAWRGRGRVAIAVGTAILSALPLGGAVAVVAQELGSRLCDGQLEGKFTALCKLVAELQPDLERLDALDERLCAVAAALESCQGVLRILIEGLREQAPKEFLVQTTGGVQEFVNITIRNMRVLVTADEGGRNLLSGVHAVGENAHFIATSGGNQRVQNSTFEGAAGSVRMDRLELSGRVSTDTGARDPGIGLGEDGSIGFGPGGVLSFGPPKKR